MWFLQNYSGSYCVLRVVRRVLPQIPAHAGHIISPCRLSRRSERREANGCRAQDTASTKGPNWSPKRDLPRFMSVLMDDIAPFAARDEDLSRKQKDATDLKPFWPASR